MAKHSPIALLSFAVCNVVVKPFRLYGSQAGTLNENDRRRTVATEIYFVCQAAIAVGHPKKRVRHYGDITD
jgi:hypothetical protein